MVNAMTAFGLFIWRVAARLFAAGANDGVAAVEFAICALVFLMIVAATVDIGMLIFTQSELDAAVAAGAQYAATSGGASSTTVTPSQLQLDIQTIVDNANGTSWASSTVNVNNSGDTTGCYCPTGTTGSWTWGSTVTCANLCPSGGVGGQFVMITATTNVSPLFSAFGFVASGTISSNALVETQ